MSECVSCGKEVPAGKFFCDDCYVKMKGKRGPSAELPLPSGDAPRQPPTAGAPGPGAAPPEAAPTETVVPMKKASGTLTPTSGKKVVSMRSGAEKTAKEKAGKKRFKVTISFSERTYDRLSRLRRGRGEAGAVSGGDAAAARLHRPRAGKGAPSGKGRGKPRLRAVSVPGAAVKTGSGLGKAIAYRDRALDGKDLIATATAVFTVPAIVILCFLPWARVTWGTGDATGFQAVEVTGTDLGAMTYVCMAVAVLALLYMAATLTFKGAYTAVDFGVVFIAAGMLLCMLLFIIIASNGRFLSAAVQEAGMGVDYLPAQFERQTLWPAYAMVLLGAILGFAGLVRISERKAAGPGETSE